MALFTEAEHFGAGAALRAVTDWAHYNDGYTSNILNTPAEDSRGVPALLADLLRRGLEDPLLMTHGLVDVNVQPQDIFRLSQRLIELGTRRTGSWRSTPSRTTASWSPRAGTDQYRRILELFERHLGRPATRTTQ
jgi:dipeptidyl aminopeptidase/acylaminoacyl peptidase